MASSEILQSKVSKKFTKDVLKEIVEKYSNLNEIVINKITLGEESKKGDSYLSSVTKFTINATGKSKDGQTKETFVPVIVKALLNNVGRRKTFRSADFFENEIIFYEKVWPEMLRFQQTKNVQNPFNSIPTLLAAHIDGEDDYIAFEDLNHKGYGNALKGEGLNYEHTILILRLFARFHGLAMAFKDQHPEQFEKTASSLKETYFAEKFKPWYEDFQKRLIEITCDAVQKELPELYLKKLQQVVSNDFYSKLCKLCEVRSPFAVITHGDAWIPNFLLKYDRSDKTTPLDAIMIDFQLTRYTTLSNDLTFFLYGCTELYKEHWDDFIEEYHKTLCSVLEMYGCSPNLVSLEALKNDIKENGVFAIGMCIEALTMSMLDEDEISDLDAIQGDEAVPLSSVWIVHPLKTQEKRKRLASFIKHVVDNGLI